MAPIRAVPVIPDGEFLIFSGSGAGDHHKEQNKNRDQGSEKKTFFTFSGKMIKIAHGMASLSSLQPKRSSFKHIVLNIISEILRFVSGFRIFFIISLTA